MKFDMSETNLKYTLVALSPIDCLVAQAPPTAATTTSTAASPATPSSSQPLLGCPHPEDAGKKCLVLDLDETLAHSSFQPVDTADFVVKIKIEQTWHEVYVTKRPGVDDFLQRVARDYEVVVFTASLSLVCMYWMVWRMSMSLTDCIV